MSVRPLALVLAFGGLALAHPVRASDDATELHLHGTYSTLDNSTSDWREAALGLRHAYAPGHAVEARLRQTKRFGLEDLEAAGSLLLPLAGSWSVLGEASYSPDHRVLPRSGIYLGAAGKLGRGFSAGAGARSLHYSADQVWVLNAFTEYYWARYRAAYTLFQGHLEGGGDGLTHLLQGDIYYAAGQIGLALVTGEEAARVSPTQVQVAEVFNAVLLGRHWFAPSWGLSYEIGRYRQDPFYTRSELQLGLHYRF